MKQQQTHWSVIIDIIEAALTRDPDKVRNFAELLAGRLEESGEVVIARNIRRKLQKTTIPNRPSMGSSATILTPQAVFAPVDPESRSTFTDEVRVTENEPLILPHNAMVEVDRLIKMQKMSDAFIQEDIPVPSSLLLYGPPGCGKSSSARYIARSLGLPLLILRLDAVMSSYLGNTAKNLRSVFEYASRRGAILFLDEFDAVAKMRDDSNEVGEIKRIVNSLIQNLDAFPGIFVIAATNHEHLLDPAVWRRFDATILIPLPGKEERKRLLTEFLGREEIESDLLSSILDLTDGFSGADIEHVVVRSRQEKLLHHSTPLIQLLVREIWYRIEGNANVFALTQDEKTSIMRFIDSRTESRLSTRTLASLVGISHTSVARMRHSEGE